MLRLSGCLSNAISVHEHQFEFEAQLQQYANLDHDDHWQRGESTAPRYTQRAAHRNDPLVYAAVVVGCTAPIDGAVFFRS